MADERHRNRRRRTLCYRCGEVKLHYTLMRSGRRKRQTTKPCIDCRREVGKAAPSNAPEYRTWKAMLARCGNPLHRNYHDYGGRGIIVCKRWRGSFDAFLADMGSRPSLHSIDRKDNDGNYEPGNCRWATAAEQARNRRDSWVLSLNGVSRSLCDWADELGIARTTLVKRKKAGWSDEETLTTPISERHSRRPVTAAMRTKMRKLRRADVPYREIARRLGISQTTVFHHVG